MEQPTSRALWRRLREFEPFCRMRGDLPADLVGTLDRVCLEPGQVLVREGEAPDRVFVLLDGRLEVQHPEARAAGERLAELEPGALIGEIAVLAGGKRSATVAAIAPSELACLSADAFQRLLDKEPEILEELVVGARHRLRRSQLAVFLARIFDSLDAEVLRDLESEVEWVTLRGGDVLFREGDAPDGAYIVIAGRLRVSVREDGGERLINEVGRGEPIGEMALLSDGLRSATATAARDTDLARISDEGFTRLIERYPTVLKQITGFVVERLRHHANGHSGRPGALITVAAVPMSAGVDISGFARQLAASLEEFGPTLHLDAVRVSRGLGRDGIAHIPRSDPGHIRLVQWLDEQEAAYRYVVYEALPVRSGWTDRCIHQADRVLLVADAGGDPAPAPAEPRPDSADGRRRSLILLQSSATDEYRDTARWLEQRVVHDHYHVRPNSVADFARLARTLTGHAVGLVLGGGGARGFAHIGVLRALQDVGVPIDLVGGTSIGAVIAAGTAMGLDAREVLEYSQRHFARIFDPTLPVVSLLAGRRIHRQLGEAFEERRIEDLSIPYFCVSSNLTRAQETVHRQGLLLRAVRASISLPGILPPVSQSGDVLVDGGLLNNLPIDVMTELSFGGPVVGVDVSPDEDLTAAAEMATQLSGWRILWSRLNPFQHNEAVPHIINVLMRSTVVASIAAERHKRFDDSSTLYLKLPVQEWKLLEFGSVHEIEERGYELTVDRLAAWWEERSRKVSAERVDRVGPAVTFGR